MKIAIMGSGVTALTAAYNLKRNGHHVTVYEKSPAAGGLASSVELGECRFDFGPHEFITNNPTLVNLLRDVLGDDLMQIEKAAAQYLFGRYINYPSKPLQLAFALPPGLTFRIGCEVVLNKFKMLFANPSDYSFKSWVVNRFGSTLYDVYFGPYTKKVWGIDPDLLDARTASDRIAFDSFFDFVWQTCVHYFLKFQNFRNTHNPMREDFYYSRGGIGTLTSSLYRTCRESGVDFCFGSEMTGIETSADRVVAIEINGQDRKADFDFLYTTVPLNGLCALLGDDEPDLTFRSMVFVFMKFKGISNVPFQWIYTPSKGQLFQRLTNYEKFDADLCPEGYSGLGAEIACDYGDEIWNLNDDVIVERVLGALEGMELFEPASFPPEAKIIRQRYAYPLQKAGYLENIQKALDSVSKLTNLVTLGRQGQFKYCNMNECMEMALDATDSLHRGEPYRYSISSKWKGAGMDTERTLDEDRV